MAHEIDFSNNRANMAFTGSRQAVWHGLGQELQEDTSIEDWKTAAGLDWEVIPADVQYVIPAAQSFLPPDVKTMPNRKVLYRSDTSEALSVVSGDFKIVQPGEVVDFFRDLTAQNNMKLSTAGSLFGGRRFWALAELGKDFEVTSGDTVSGYLLLTTAVDGSLQTTAKFVSTRVVCQNTLNISLSEANKNLIRVSHRSQWDADQVKLDLGVMDAAWIDFMSNIRKLANTPTSDATARTFFADMLRNPDQKELTKVQEKKAENLFHLYKNGVGADMSGDSYWGILNAVTEAYTHGTGRRAADHQFWDNYYGAQSSIKDRAYFKALEAVA